jgi:hypothetical protein
LNNQIATNKMRINITSAIRNNPQISNIEFY